MTMKITGLKNYIQSALGFKIKAAKTKLNVPFSIQDAFQFFELDIYLPNGALIPLLAIIQHDGEYPGIVALKKRLAVIEKKTERVVVYVTNTLSFVERKSLIEQQINFISIDRQFFIPELAMDLREAFRMRKQNQERGTEFSPATQAILIRLLYDGWNQSGLAYNAYELMAPYKYSRVTLSKVTTELINADILIPDTEEAFTTKRYTFTHSQKDTFKKALPMMRSPVKKTVMVNKIPKLGKDVCYSGDTALAKYTLLSSGRHPVFAMTQKIYTTFLESGQFKEVTDIDSAKATIEIWRYRSPKSSTNVVDEISLYLAFKDNPDERIQLSLDEIKENYPWMKFAD
ncbi:hypothetical protein [Pectobacterium aquaticum]|uniref:MarR family transcriptional regulator n=1 Tax=Pectobacterium aquaticum TaxID=2204145 RepID=A0AA93AP61_9GAMM|nr:hypothetical protein [Pectobacterium aquaticum]RRO23228.1 hypothetical protein DMB84_004135 [Pectobacterium aquaticum]